MSIYRFRVLIDHDSEAFRDIEIASEQTFLEFHDAIKEAFGFKGKEMACFYVSDAEWGKGIEIPLADMGFGEDGKVPLLMDEVQVGDHVREPAQRFVYAYDFLNMWMFLVERIGTGDPDPTITYPHVAMAVGQPPGEHDANGTFGTPEDFADPDEDPAHGLDDEDEEEDDPLGHSEEHDEGYY